MQGVWHSDPLPSQVSQCVDGPLPIAYLASQPLAANGTHPCPITTSGCGKHGKVSLRLFVFQTSQLLTYSPGSQKELHEVSQRDPQDNIHGITKPVVCRPSHQHSTKCISVLIYKEICGVLKVFFKIVCIVWPFVPRLMLTSWPRSSTIQSSTLPSLLSRLLHLNAKSLARSLPPLSMSSMAPTDQDSPRSSNTL